MIYYGAPVELEIAEEGYPESAIAFEIRFAESFDEDGSPEDEETEDSIWADADNEKDLEETREEAMEMLRDLEKQGYEINWDITDEFRL